MLPTSFTRRRAMMLFALAVAGACSADKLVGPSLTPSAPLASPLASGGVVISQVYGGGGNGGATYRNDYIELYNNSASPVDLSTWSVQYASSAGSTWQKTNLTGTIQPGQYYLVQEASQAAVGALMPTPDASGTIPMAAGAGKVALVSNQTQITTGISCPTATAVDFLGYGSGTNCVEGTGNTTSISAILAAFRKDGGRTDTDVNSADFANALPAPRNTASPLLTPTGGVVVTPHTVTSVTVSPASPSITAGGSQAFTAIALDSVNVAVTGTAFTWASSNPAVATINATTGAASALTAGTTTISAMTANGTIGQATLTVTAPVVTVPPAPGLVISQVYGAGGNSGAQYKNDFIELYNGGTTPVDLAGWSVQYSSAVTTPPATPVWFRTALTGTIQPGHYFLIQESAGTGGTVNLPTPDFVAAGADILAMGGTGGKIALVRGTAPLAGSCPVTDALVADFVGYGVNSSGVAADCFEGAGPTAAVSATLAAFRKDGGRQDSNSNSADFTVAAPAPRNAATTALPPLAVLQATITPASPAAVVGVTVPFTASAAQFGGAVAVTSAAWTSSNPAVATIDPATGIATANAIGTTTIGVALVTANGPVSATTTLTVSAAPAVVTLAPATWSLKVGQAKAFAASAVDATGSPTSSSYTWASSNPAIATVDAAGLATGLAAGTVTITATSSNGIAGTATLMVTVGNVNVGARAAADGPLPVGFQTQFFLSGGSTDAAGAPVFNSTVTWSTSDPSIASINASTGVVTALRAGSVSVIATAKSDNLSSGSTTLNTKVPDFASTARLGHNTELGVPVDADPSDDVIIARRTYTLSYNATRGGPNWVSWNLDGTHRGSAARCNCMTADTALTRLGIRAFNTAEWVGGGFSRGHMSPSADWSDSDGDNASTFFMSNMIPQNQDANGGAWGDFEDYLRTLAPIGSSTEVYIVAGPIFTPGRTAGKDGFGFLNNGTPIAVPDSMWKVAVVVPDARSASQIGAPTDVTVLAINMENSSVTTGSWSQAQYQTTIAKIERSTGYNLLAALPEHIQCKLEKRNCVPAAAITGAGLAGGDEGQVLTFSGATSSDGDNDALGYAWTLNGSAVGTGASLSYPFATAGSYTLALTVSDGNGGTSTTSETIVINNVAPAITPFAGGTIAEGGSYAAAGAFVDPGTGPWTATVDYGDGSGAQPLALSGKGFSLSHGYANDGTFTVTVTVSEPGAATATSTATVTVTNVAPAVAPLTGASIAESGMYAASGSFADPGSDAWTATVNYGDGSGVQALALGADKSFSLSHAYADNGTYTVTVTVTETAGGTASGTGTATVAVTNVAPAVAAFSGASILRTERYTASGSFADVGSADTHTATVSYGDGSGTSALALTGTSFSLDHAYNTAGTFTVTVTVTDDDGGVGTRTAQVVVQSAAQGTPALVALVSTLNGTLGSGEVNSLQAKLSAVGASLRRENDTPARNQLDAFVNEVNALVASGRLTAAQAAPLLDYAARLRASIGVAAMT